MKCAHCGHWVKRPCTSDGSDHLRCIRFSSGRQRAITDCHCIVCEVYRRLQSGEDPEDRLGGVEAVNSIEGAVK